MNKNTSITQQILIAMAVGLIIGSLINTFADTNEWIKSFIVQGVFHVIGSGFVNALKMLVVPLVTFSLICGVCGMGDIALLGRVGFKAFGLYLITTGLAVSLALYGYSDQPWAGLSEKHSTALRIHTQAVTTTH